MGRHTGPIFNELGYDDAAVGDLVENGIVVTGRGWRPDPIDRGHLSVLAPPGRRRNAAGRR